MVDLNDYFYYVHVVEKRGYSAAAKVLNMPKSRLSRHIQQLEERLGVRLIQRTSRQFHITEVGQTFYAHARAVIDEMNAAESAVKRTLNTTTGLVRISCSVGIAQFLLKELLIEFLADNSKVELVQQVTNQNIDLVAEGIDLAIRGHTSALPDSSLIQRHLASVPWHLFAGSAFIEKYGKPSSPSELINCPSLKLGWQPTSGNWLLENKSGEKISVTLKPQLCSDDMSTLKGAAQSGLGIVSLPAYACRDEIKNGKLIRILPNWTAGVAGLSLLMPARKGLTPAVQALSEFLIERTKACVEGDTA